MEPAAPIQKKMSPPYLYHPGWIFGTPHIQHRAKLPHPHGFEFELQEDGQESSPRDDAIQENFSTPAADIGQRSKHKVADVMESSSSKRQKTAQAGEATLDTILTPWFKLFRDPSPDLMKRLVTTINHVKCLEYVTDRDVSLWFWMRRHKGADGNFSGPSPCPTDLVSCKTRVLDHDQGSPAGITSQTSPMSRGQIRGLQCPFEGCANVQKNLSAWKRHFMESHCSTKYGCICCYIDEKNNVCKLCDENISALDQVGIHVMDCFKKNENRLRSLSKRTNGWFKDESKFREHMKKHTGTSYKIPNQLWKMVLPLPSPVYCVSCSRRFGSWKLLTSHIVSIHKM